MNSSRLLAISLLSALLVACSGSGEDTPVGAPVGVSGSSGAGGSSAAGAGGSGAGKGGSSGSSGGSAAGAAGAKVGGAGGTSSAGQAGAGEGGASGEAGASGEGGSAGSQGPAGSGGKAGEAGAAGAEAGSGGAAGAGAAGAGAAGAAGAAGEGGGAGGGAGGAAPCPEGYEGEGCAQCAFGFVMHDGACVMACEVKDCGNGICSLAENNTTYCTCDTGWSGAACDACAPGYRPKLVMIGQKSECELDEPSASAKNLALWLDADRDDSFLLAPDGSSVLRWYSRLEGDSQYFSSGGQASARPARKGSEVSVRRWIHFDGVDDHLQRTLDLQTAGYSIFVVVQASATDQVQTLLSGVKVGTILHGLQLQATNMGKDLFFRHKLPSNGGASDDVTQADLPTSTATVVEVHRGVLGNQPVYQVYNGSTYVSTAGTAPAFQDQLMLHLGIRGDSDTFPLEGRIGEVLIFSTTLPINERAKVRDYLKSKWMP